MGTYATKYSTTGTVILNTASLPSPVVPLTSGTEIQMPGGGLYYVGATQLSLNGIANSTNNFYNGCTINITTPYVSVDAYGNLQPVSYRTFSAKITSYTALGCIAVLDTPVNVAIGYNSLIGADVTSTYSLNGTYTNYTLGVQNGGLSRSEEHTSELQSH